MGASFGATARSQTVFLGGHHYKVNGQQRIILSTLRDAAPATVSYEQMALALWGGLPGPVNERGCMKVLVCQCRKIIGPAIINISKLGWFLEPQNLKHNK